MEYTTGIETSEYTTEKDGLCMMLSYRAGVNYQSEMAMGKIEKQKKSAFCDKDFLINVTTGALTKPSANSIYKEGWNKSRIGLYIATQTREMLERARYHLAQPSQDWERIWLLRKKKSTYR